MYVHNMCVCMRIVIFFVLALITVRYGKLFYFLAAVSFRYFKRSSFLVNSNLLTVTWRRNSRTTSRFNVVVATV